MAEVLQDVAADPKAAPIPAVVVADPPAGDATTTEPRVYSQEDLDRITAKVKKNERYRTRKEIEAYYQGRESIAAPAKKPEKPAEEVVPTREQYDNYETFLEAKAEYVARKAGREERAKLEREHADKQATEANQKVMQTFQAKVRAKYPDIEERLEAIGHIEMPSGMGSAIAESDLGSEILNHFAENPKDCERIAALSPSAAIREIGRLEARLEKPAATPIAAAKPSAAPDPIKPGGGASGTGDADPSDKDSTEEWMRKERARVRKKYG